MWTELRNWQKNIKIPRAEQQEEAFTTLRAKDQRRSVPEPSGTQSLGGGAAWMSCRQRGIHPLPDRQVPKQRENEEEMVILFSIPTTSPGAEPNEMPSDKEAK